MAISATTTREEKGNNERRWQSWYSNSSGCQWYNAYNINNIVKSYTVFDEISFGVKIYKDEKYNLMRMQSIEQFHFFFYIISTDSMNTLNHVGC